MKTNKIVRFVVTCIDSGESADGRPRFLGAFKTRQKAIDFIEKDIQGYEKQGMIVDYDDWLAETCVWNMEEVEIA